MCNDLQMQILEILIEDARTPADRIAVMLGIGENQVRGMIASLEKQGILLKYTTVINQELLDADRVQAMIEVRVTPQREKGFDEMAAQIYRFEEVKSLYLMSGAYDLLVMVEAKSLKTLALFVSEKLSTLEHVTGTATHFVLKTYKVEGVIYEGCVRDQRLAVSP
ncbi:MAG: Lrp/AsnC family transcriptional regulator [Clostridia bacterium]